MKHPLTYGFALVLVSTAVVGMLSFRPFRLPVTQADNRTSVTELDFEIVGGRIYVPAEINGHKTSAILDTGASSSVLNLALAGQWDLPTQGALNAQGIGGGPITGKVLNDVVVTIGNITEQIPYAIPLDSLATMEGRRLEVILGSQFFLKHIVEVDYAKRHLRIFDGGADVSLKGIAVPIHIVNSLPHITSIMVVGGAEYKLEAMVDTGASSGLTAMFLNAHQLNVTKTERTVIAGGAGGYVEGRFFRPDSVKLGSVSLAKPVITLTETGGGLTGGGAKYDILIGGDLMRRFRVTFDYPHTRMMLEASDEVSQPFEADKTGLRIYAQGSDLRSFKIVGVLGGSSSDKAGIIVDDVIESIDSVPASQFTLQQLRELFRSPTALKWELGIRRGDQRLKLTVAAKSII
jgi:predicted aspartyl protease